MPSRQIGLNLCAAGLALIVGACGSGEPQGSAAVPIVVAPTAPAPSPTATPAPTTNPATAQYPQAPFGSSQVQSYSLLGWTGAGVGMERLDETQFQLGWGLSPDTYRLTMPGLSDATLRYTFPGNNPYAFTAVNRNGQTTDQRASISTGKLVGVPFFFTGALSLFRESSEQQPRPVQALFGIATAPANFPASEKRLFRFDEFTRPWDVEVDFSTGNVTGKVSLAWTDAWGPYEPVLYTIEKGRFDRTTGEISGEFTASGTAIAGILHGRLMGPHAAELALAYSGPVFNPYDKQFEREWFTSPGILCTSC